MSNFLQEKYGYYHKAFLKDFVEYLETTTEDSWCKDVVRNRNGQNCLFGHLSNFCQHKPDDNITNDFDWFENYVASTYMIYPVNDGSSEKYTQSTPKQRCIRYMADILSGDELNTIESMDACWKAYKEQRDNVSHETYSLDDKLNEK